MYTNGIVLQHTAAALKQCSHDRREPQDSAQKHLVRSNRATRGPAPPWPFRTRIFLAGGALLGRYECVAVALEYLSLWLL